MEEKKDSLNDINMYLSWTKWMLQYTGSENRGSLKTAYIRKDF